LQGIPHNRPTLFVIKQPKGGLAGPLFWTVTALLAIALVIVPSAGAETVPAGFQARKLPILKSTEASAPKYINGLTRPTAIAFGPDGKMYVAEWLGRVKVFDSVEDTTPTLSVDIATEVHTFGDRGLLGMKLDPEFGTTGHNFIYLSYAYDVPMGSLAAPSPEFSDGGDFCDNEDPFTDCLVSGKVVRIALDPATGVAAAGATEPPQQQLVQSWCQQFNSHSMGDLEFDSSGALLVSGGEGANYAASDYGQYSNPCGDPVNAGGSLRAQDVREGGDQTDYSGSIIRIDPETGEALPDNPLHVSSDVRARRILAYGLRNPFRFTIRPGTDEIYVGDVGQATWEELDRLTSPPVPGQGALNFGWPCYEGGNGLNSVMPAWKAFTEEVPSHAPLCQALYEHPSQVTAPLWAYGHGVPDGYLFPGDTCDPTPGSAYSGLAFYDPTGVSPSAAFPAKYQGALFMADAARGCIWVMGAGSDGRPDPTDITNFAVGDGAGKISPVDLVQGPDGALYAPNFYSESIEQIRYFDANEPPVAKLEANKVDGALVGGKLTVHFDASASSDKEGDDFSYEWDLDGDGQFDDGSDQPTEEWTYTNENDVTARVRVKDEFGRTDQTAVQIYPGDLGPPSVPTIEAPSPSLHWAVGDTIDYAGSATDPDGGPLTYKWRISIQHCPSACHEHPYIEPEGPSGSLTAPPHEYPSHLSFILTATDDRGRSTPSLTLQSFPQVIDVGLASEPTGIPVTFDGEPASAGPFHLIAGGSANVSAPATATVGGISYVFSSWSDGGAASHEISSKQSMNLVAHYTPAAGPPSPPPSPEPAKKVRLSIVSRPLGIKLQAGKSKRRAPFTISVTQGTKVALKAPAKVTKGKRHYRLEGWLIKGKLKRKPAVTVVGRAPGRYVAVYAAG